MSMCTRNTCNGVPTMLDWTNTPWTCPTCGYTVPKIQGPPSSKEQREDRRRRR
jgi:hypothetical protein